MKKEFSRPLPPLTDLEREAVEAARKGRSACTAHLADMGIIDEKVVKKYYQALRRVAIRAGIYKGGGEPWIGELGLMIYGDDIKSEGKK